MSKHMSTEPRADVYTRVTSKIINDLEAGVPPWRKPWSAEHAAGHITRPLRANGEPYRGVNVLLLWSEAVERGYQASTWMTYRQAATLGGNVRKGETGSLVVFANRFTAKDVDDHGQETEREIPYLKAYTVFNTEQVQGLPPQFNAAPTVYNPAERIESAEAFFAATGATIRHGGNRAYYAPGLDLIQMPQRECFRDAESYCATAAHELTHWTSHPSRLARELGKRFGDEAYAAEELIAEMGSAFLCADLGIAPEAREDHAAYIAHWLKVLKADSRAIFTAASLAQRAADFLHGCGEAQRAAA
jgi:antirestriction protein ArdC